MKILHIGYKLDDASAATRLAKAQREKDLVFFFVGRNSTSEFVRANQVAKVPGLIIGVVFHIINIILIRILGLQKGEIFSINFGEFFQKIILKKIIEKYKIDVVHIHWGGYGFFPLSAAADINKPIVLTAHDYQVFAGGCHVPMGCPEFNGGCINCPLAKKSFGKLVVKKIRVSNARALKNVAPIIISPSKYVRQKILSEYPFLSVRVVPNTLDEIYFENKINELIRVKSDPIERWIPRIITVGVNASKRQNKGADILRDLLNRLSSEGLEFNYTSIGEFIDIKGARDRIHFDRLNAEELLKHYLESDVCILPSRYETFSMVSLEAICCGVRVVAFDKSGPSDIVADGVSGRLVPAFDVNQFFLATVEMLKQSRNKNDFVYDGLDRYSPKNVARIHHEIYKELRKARKFECH